MYFVARLEGGGSGLKEKIENKTEWSGAIHTATSRGL